MVLVVATLALDILAGLFWLAGSLHLLPVDTLSWSHGLFMTILWSIVAALVVIPRYHSIRTSMVIGTLVFSHWILDYVMWPAKISLLYAGGPAIGLNLGNSKVVGIAFETGVLILGIVIYFQVRKASTKIQANPANQD
jgi:hypothetical protein